MVCLIVTVAVNWLGGYIPILVVEDEIFVLVLAGSDSYDLPIASAMLSALLEQYLLDVRNTSLNHFQLFWALIKWLG